MASMIAKGKRAIPISDFIKILLCNVTDKLLAGKIDKKEYDNDRLDMRIADFLAYNNIPIDKDVRDINIDLDTLNNEYLNKFYNDYFEEKDNIALDNFKLSFISKFRSLLSSINNFDKNVSYQLGINKLEIAIMLRLFNEIEKQIYYIIMNSNNLKIYLNRLKIAEALNIPKSLEEYLAFAKQYNVIHSIEKALERLRLQPNNEKLDYDQEEKITKLYILPPNHNDTLNSLKDIASMDIPCTEMEKKLRQLAKAYCSFYVIEVFTNNTHLLELVNAVCNNDIYKDSFKNLLIEWHKTATHKQKIFNRFIEEKIEELWCKRLDLSEHIVRIIGLIIYMIDEGSNVKIINQKVNSILDKMYEGVAKNNSIDNTLKNIKLKEIHSIRKNYGNTTKVIEFQQIYKELITNKVDINKHFFENHYQQNPIKYMFLIFLAYKLNNISFFQKLLLKSYKENRMLRNYARDLLYKKLEGNKKHFTADRSELAKSIFREYFLSISNDKENVSYRKEVLRYLITMILSLSNPPYEAFYNDLTDIFLSEIKKSLDTHLFNKVITGKPLKPFEKRKLEVSKYLMADQLLPRMLKELTKQKSKEIYLRKIKLRFGHEYKTIEEKYHKMESKTSI